MLRVTLEIVPFGIHEKTRILGTMTISNVGGTPEAGDYKIKIGQPAEDHYAEADLKYYPRKNGAWSLVLLALSKIDFR